VLAHVQRACSVSTNRKKTVLLTGACVEPPGTSSRAYFLQHLKAWNFLRFSYSPGHRPIRADNSVPKNGLYCYAIPIISPSNPFPTENQSLTLWFSAILNPLMHRAHRWRSPSARSSGRKWRHTMMLEVQSRIDDSDWTGWIQIGQVWQTASCPPPNWPNPIYNHFTSASPRSLRLRNDGLSTWPAVLHSDFFFLIRLHLRTFERHVPFSPARAGGGIAFSNRSRPLGERGYSQPAQIEVQCARFVDVPDSGVEWDREGG